MTGLLVNINSSINPEGIVKGEYTDSWVYSYVHDIPVYLVDPDTMDKICPPEWSSGIPLEKKKGLDEIIDSFLNAPGEDIDEELDRVFRRIKEFRRTFVCDGVFIDQGPGYIDDHSVKYPAVFVTPERIHESSTKISRDTGYDVETVFRGLMKSAITHEYTHAFNWKLSNGVNTRRYSEEHVKIIEELIAQLTSYSNLSVMYRVFFTKKSTSQPLEYNTWKPFTALCRGFYSQCSYDLAYLWSKYMIRNKKPPIFEAISPLPPILLLLSAPIDPFILHELSVVFGYHRFFHRVIEPFIVRLYRGGRLDVEKYLKVLALLLLERAG